MSIAVTYISAITIIGFPAETYLFGTILFWFGVSAIIPKTVACIYYIPLIDRLRLSTINEVSSTAEHFLKASFKSAIGFYLKSFWKKKIKNINIIFQN